MRESTAPKGLQDCWFQKLLSRIFFFAGLLPGSVLFAVWGVWAVFYAFDSVFHSLPFTHSFHILGACANK